MKKTRVLLADDHKIVIEGLKNLLEGEFEIVGSVEDGRALVKQASTSHPDVIVADISMHRLNGIEAAQQIKKIDENIKIVFEQRRFECSLALDGRIPNGTCVSQSSGSCRPAMRLRNATTTEPNIRSVCYCTNRGQRVNVY